MIVTKKRLVREAAGTLMSMRGDSLFEPVSATFALSRFLSRLGIPGHDLLVEYIERQQEHEDGRDEH